MSFLLLLSLFFSNDVFSSPTMSFLPLCLFSELCDAPRFLSCLCADTERPMSCLVSLPSAHHVLSHLLPFAPCFLSCFLSCFLVCLLSDTERPGKTGVADRDKIELELNNLNSILSRSAVTPVFPGNSSRRVILKIELELNNLNSIFSRSAVTPVFPRLMSSLVSFLSAPHVFSRRVPFLFSERPMFSHVFSQTAPPLLSYTECSCLCLFRHTYRE